MNLYHLFLDFPESEDSPDLYALLGIPRFTGDLKVIRAAAISRNSKLKSWQNSKYYRESDQLLDEVAAAAVTLEDPQRKSEYDRQLRERLGLPEVVLQQPVAVSPLPVRSPVPSRANADAKGQASWDARLVGTLTGHGSSVNRLAFNLDGTQIASAATGVVKRWDVLRGREAQELKGHWGMVHCVAYNPDGTRLATAGDDQVVKVWDAAGRALQSFKGHGDKVAAVTFSPNGQYIASASADQSVRIWDVNSGKGLTLKGHTVPVKGVVFQSDGFHAVSVDKNRTILIWDLRVGSEVARFPGKGDFVTNVTFSPDSERVATASQLTRGVRLWNLKTNREAALLSSESEVTGMAFSRDGLRVALGHENTDVTIWDAATGTLQLTLSGHRDQVNCLDFSPDGKRLASAGVDRLIRIWWVGDTVR